MSGISSKSNSSKWSKNNFISMQSELKHNLGDELANVVFELSHKEINKCLGLSPPLIGPVKNLWISPSDQLIGKNYLKPPIHIDCIKACTHEAILQIGNDAVEKYRYFIEEEMKMEIFKQLIDEKNLCEAEKRRAVELILKKIKEQYKNRILELKSRFNEELKSELEKTMEDCKLKMQESILQERENITCQMLKKIRDEFDVTITSLHHDFELELLAEKQKMIMEFNQIMRCNRIKTEATMKNIIRQKDEDYQIKFREQELQKIVDLTYVLCSERMRCSAEKEEMQQTFEEQVKTLQKMLLEANNVIQLLKRKSFVSENEESHEGESDEQWKEKITEIVKQFQKFINFAFDAIPGQAEFLLSLESLLTFEINKEILKKDEKLEVEKNGVFHVVEIIDKYGEKWKPVQLITDIYEPCFTDNEFTIMDNKNSFKNSTNGTFQFSSSFCNFRNKVFERVNFNSENIEKERKTMNELEDDAHFVFKLEWIKNSDSKLKQEKTLKKNENQIKPGLSREGLLEKISSHNKIIKSVSQVKKNGEQIFKIVGDNGVEHFQTFKEFTISRMQSLNRIFKLHSSLQHILIH